MKKEKGFTLIELLVVIAVIGLIASVVLVALNDSRKKARDTKRKADVAQISKAANVYFSNHSQYPHASYAGNCGTALTGSDAVSTGLISDGIISKMPTPPPGSLASGCGSGDYYYAGSTANGNGIADDQWFVVIGILESADSNCKAFSNPSSYYTSGSFCSFPAPVAPAFLMESQ